MSMIKQNLTANKDALESQDYQTVMSVIEHVEKKGVLEHAEGNCIAMSELVQHLLMESGINSKLVECRLMVTQVEDGRVVNFGYVGWDGGKNKDPAYVDTHVVVVTETANPILIDLSVGRTLPRGRQWVIEPVNSLDPDKIAEYNYGNHKVSYTVKKNPRLLGLHQTSLLERMGTEQRLIRSTNWLKSAVIALTVMALFNFILNIGILIFNS